MAGTAPACTEVLSSCIPVYDSFLDTFFDQKMTKSRKKLISYTRSPYALRNSTEWDWWYDTSLSVSENEACSRPYGTHLIKRGYTVERLGSDSKTCAVSSSYARTEVLCNSSKASKWRFCIYCLSFDNEADCPETARVTIRFSISNPISSPRN